MKDPQRVAINSLSAVSKNLVPVKSTNHANSNSGGKTADRDDAVVTTETDNFAIPASLKQYFVITPCKLRLVVLLTLIMSKIRVRNV